MIRRRFWLKYMFPCFIGCLTSASAQPITWTAQSPNSDMNNPANWTPNTIPGSSDNALFNSTISGVDTNPTENWAPFSVSTFNFPFNASIFNFRFNNQTLTFNGTGITGSNTTNPTITSQTLTTVLFLETSFLSLEERELLAAPSSLVQIAVY